MSERRGVGLGNWLQIGSRPEAGRHVVSRRGFTSSMLLGALGSRSPSLAQARAPATRPAPAKPVVAWMYIIYPIEQWLTDYQRTLDAWAEGGVRGIVIGPLVFFKEVPRFDYTYARPGFKFPTFAPDPAIYRKHGVDPPADAPRDP